MFICQFGMHKIVQGYRNANVHKQTYDASYSEVKITSKGTARLGVAATTPDVD